MAMDTLITISNLVANFFILALGLFLMVITLFLFSCLVSMFIQERKR